MYITFSGNDGSGKSFIIKEINKKGLFMVIGEFDYILLSVLKKLLPEKTQKTQKKILIDSSKESLIKKLLPYITYIDLLIQHILYTYIFKKNIIRDRNAIDFLATWKEQNISNAFLDYLYVNFPKPDLSFYIDTSPEIALERVKKRLMKKGKLNDEKISTQFFTKKYAIYKKILKKEDIIINNNISNNDAIDKIKDIISLKSMENKKISISGLDGAGKSTAINLLEKELKKHGVKIKTLHFYYNYIPVKIFKFIKKTLGNKQGINEKVQHEKSIEHEKKAIKSQKGVFWVAYVIFDAWIQYLWVTIFYPRHLIIFDRFFYDYLVSFDFLRVKYDKNLLMKFFPKIDKNFILLAPPEVLYKRKPEHTKEFFKNCHFQYEELAKQFKIELVDTDKNQPQEVVNILMHKIS